VYYYEGRDWPGGPPFMGPRGRGHWGGSRRRRGDVRAAILLLLEEEPRNGYQLMQELEERSEGAWRPSPGSVYPALQLLADEGFVRGEPREGSTLYELTDPGRKHLDENRDRFGVPWEQAFAGTPELVRQLFRLAMQVGIATRQVVHAGTEAQRKEAAELLAETRRRLYGILAENGG